MRLIAICGFAGSGKDTIANYLIRRHNYEKLSFAGVLKDAVAVIFGWDRGALEGDTPTGREWREKTDVWWSERLQMPGLTPRRVLQLVGTDLFRQRFHDDIWVAAVERRITNTASPIVITDCRFPNEIEMVRRVGGVVWNVDREAVRPTWFPQLVEASKHGSPHIAEEMAAVGAHPSEWLWFSAFTKKGEGITISNNGGEDELFAAVARELSRSREAEGRCGGAPN
jgi:hypothetical protein